MSAGAGDDDDDDDDGDEDLTDESELDMMLVTKMHVCSH